MSARQHAAQDTLERVVSITCVSVLEILRLSLRDPITLPECYDYDPIAMIGGERVVQLFTEPILTLMMVN